jgi:AICAR transformylase/IMP cyclohydrolase PurH
LARGDRLPLTVLNGSPGYINILDALTAWQLVRELKAVTGKEAAASFKHVSPAGAAVAGPIGEAFAQSQFLDRVPDSPVASAYVRARGADRMSSFGDAVAVSDRVDPELADVLKAEVSDVVIAPSYDADALRLLRTKRRGQYLILRIDPDYEPEALESRDVFGLTLEQERNARLITPDLFDAVEPIPPSEVESLVVATTALKYTQSNSACVAHRGQVIGLGAGQQSRIHCTRLACSKAEKWMLQTHPKVLGLRFPSGMGRPERTNAVDQYVLWHELSEAERSHFIGTMGYGPEPLSAAERRSWFETFDGLVMSSDAFIPFRDNIDRAAMSGVSYIAHAGGSIRDESVRQAAAELGITVIETGVRCFLH